MLADTVASSMVRVVGRRRLAVVAVNNDRHGRQFGASLAVRHGVLKGVRRALAVRQRLKLAQRLIRVSAVRFYSPIGSRWQGDLRADLVTIPVHCHNSYVIVLWIAVVHQGIVAERQFLAARHIPRVHVILFHRRAIHIRHQDYPRGFIDAALAIRDGVREGIHALIGIVQRVEMAAGIVLVSVLSRLAHGHHRSRRKRNDSWDPP